MTYVIKLNSSASSPCLTDLVRSSIRPGNREIVYEPMTSLGTVSQLYTQIMVPRGLTEAPELTRQLRSVSPAGSEASSDSGVVFRFGDGSSEDLNIEPVHYSALHRTHTMPELSAVHCK